MVGAACGKRWQILYVSIMIVSRHSCVGIIASCGYNRSLHFNCTCITTMDWFKLLYLVHSVEYLNTGCSRKENLLSPSIIPNIHHHLVTDLSVTPCVICLPCLIFEGEVLLWLRDPGHQLRGVPATLPAQQHQASLCPPGAVQLTRVTQIGGQAPGDISQVDTGGDHVTNLNTWRYAAISWGPVVLIW